MTTARAAMERRSGSGVLRTQSLHAHDRAAFELSDECCTIARGGINSRGTALTCTFQIGRPKHFSRALWSKDQGCAIPLVERKAVAAFCGNALHPKHISETRFDRYLIGTY